MSHPQGGATAVDGNACIKQVAWGLNLPPKMSIAHKGRGLKPSWLCQQFQAVVFISWSFLSQCRYTSPIEDFPQRHPLKKVSGKIYQSVLKKPR
jgi:hypothetical protein